jgi:Ran GTPase-activating protein (RanGAP) involved in mRNA processing and transport
MYYDIFNVDEEEEFLKSENERCQRNLEDLLDRLVKNDPTLKELVLDFGLTSHDLLRLMNVLRTNHQITKLTISYWPMGDEGACGFAKLLLENSSLKELSLRTCGISGLGAKAILTALETNTTLIKLDLSRNNFRLGHEHISTLDSIIPRMTGLEELSLYMTKLDVESVRSLMRGVQNNTSLRTLDISDNLGSVETVLDIIMEYLPQMTCLQRLTVTNGGGTTKYLDGNSVILNRLAESLDRNMSLHYLGPFSLRPMPRHTARVAQQDSVTVHEDFRRVHYILDRNKLCSRRQVLHMDQPSLWPTILAATNCMNSASSLLYFLLREKNQCMIHRSFTR